MFGSPFGVAFAIFLAALAVVPNPTCKSNDVGDPHPEKAIAQVLWARDRYTQAWTSNDTTVVMEMFTEDAVLLPHDGETPVVGHDAIRRHFWPPGSPPFHVRVFDLEALDVQVEGRFAWMSGRYRVHVHTHDQNFEDFSESEGNFVTVYKLDDDRKWRIACHIWNDPPAGT